jgi:hypothetical protein
MPSLRGHHLICLHFYRGEGYDRPFIESLNNIIKMAERGEVTVTEGADDVCRCCPYLEGNTCMYTEKAEEEIREMDRTAMELFRTKAGERVKWNQLRKSLPEIISKWAALYCRDCHWREACLKSPLYKHLLR